MLHPGGQPAAEPVGLHRFAPDALCAQLSGADNLFSPELHQIGCDGDSRLMWGLAASCRFAGPAAAEDGGALAFLHEQAPAAPSGTTDKRLPS